LSRAQAFILALLCFGFSTDVRARTRGVTGQPAPEVWAEAWRNLPKGQTKFSLKAAHGKVVYLYFFQSWCPGCHSRGFPTLKAVSQRYAERDDVVFVAIQTVFEGFSTNTAARAWSSVAEFGLKIPVGHDPGPNGRRSETMNRYRSGGTPWTVIIGSDGVVKFNGFHITPRRAFTLIDTLLSPGKTLMSLPRD